MIETHVCLMVVEAILMITVMSLCVRRLSPPPSFPAEQGSTRSEADRSPSTPTPRLSKRRSSADSCTPPVARKVKRRAASEEALCAGRTMLCELPFEQLRLLCERYEFLFQRYEFLFETLVGELGRFRNIHLSGLGDESFGFE